MIKRGQCVCNICKHIFSVDKALWHDSEKGVTFTVKRHGLTPTVGKKMTTGLLQNANIGIKRVKYCEGILSQLELRYEWKDSAGNAKGHDTVLREGNRICPYCYEAGQVSEDGDIQPLLPHMGFYDSFVFVEIGEPNVGKSTYQTTVNHNDAIELLNSMIKEYEMVGINSKQRRGVEKMHDPDALNAYTYAAFTLKKKKRICAMIYLMCTAGELTNPDNRNKTEVSCLLSLIEETADGVMMLFDPLSVDSPSLKNYRKKRNASGSIDGVVLDTLYGASKNIPTAAVMTCADELKEIAEEEMICDGDGKIVLTKNAEVLHAPAKLTADSLRCHMAISRDFFMTATHIRPAKDESQLGFFLVSSGKPLNEGGEKLFDYTQMWAAEMPLLYLLNQVKLLTLEEG